MASKTEAKIKKANKLSPLTVDNVEFDQTVEFVSGDNVGFRGTVVNYTMTDVYVELHDYVHTCSYEMLNKVG